MRMDPIPIGKALDRFIHGWMCFFCLNPKNPWDVMTFGVKLPSHLFCLRPVKKQRGVDQHHGGSEGEMDPYHLGRFMTGQPTPPI